MAGTRGEARANDGSAKFLLSRFEWATPDRLEIAGSFVGVAAPTGLATLTVQGEDGAHHLTGVPGELASDGETWSALFVWDQPPVAFEATELDLGGGLSVELSAPGTTDKAIPIRGAARSPVDALRLQVELLAAQEDAREALAAHRKILQELARARDDLEAERSDHAADAERFKQGLEEVREAGERAVSAVQAEAAGLRRRVSELEAELAEVAVLRDGLRAAESQAAEASRELEEAKVSLERVRHEAAEAEQLRSRLDAVRRAVDGGK